MGDMRSPGRSWGIATPQGEQGDGEGQILLTGIGGFPTGGGLDEQPLEGTQMLVELAERGFVHAKMDPRGVEVPVGTPTP
jgi:hypothetical protein